MVVVGHSRGTWDEVSLREKDLRILSLTLPPRTRFLGRETPSETKPHSLPNINQPSSQHTAPEKKKKTTTHNGHGTYDTQRSYSTRDTQRSLIGRHTTVTRLVRAAALHGLMRAAALHTSCHECEPLLSTYVSTKHEPLLSMSCHLYSCLNVH